MAILERAGRGRLVVIALIVLGAAGGAYAAWYRVAHPVRSGTRERAVPGEDGRITVEVLNTTDAVGLARVATRLLRDAGLDVVYFGSDTGSALDSTVVLVRRGPPGSAERVIRSLGTGTVRALPDASRLVDLTVRLGRDFGSRASVRDP